MFTSKIIMVLLLQNASSSELSSTLSEGRIKAKFDVNTLSVHPRVNAGRGKVLA